MSRVADLVAYTRAITPTKLGEEVVALVATWRDAHVRQPAERLVDLANDLLDETHSYLGERRRTLVYAVRDRLRGEERHLGATRERLGIHARHVVISAESYLTSVRQLLSAYDPARRLAQGWSIATDARGAVISSVHRVAAGDAVSVLVSDGSFSAEVRATKESPT